MENLWSDNINMIKSRILKTVYIASILTFICVLTAVILKFSVFSRPLMLEFPQKWLSPPYIYLILNLVVISIVASPKLLHSFLCISNYFKEGKNCNNDGNVTHVENTKIPPPPMLATTTAFLDDPLIYKNWNDFIHDHTPTSLLPPLEREPFDEPWSKINDYSSSIRTVRNASGRRRVDGDKSHVEIGKGRGYNISRESLVNEENNKLDDFSENSTLDGIWKTIIMDREEFLSPRSLVGSKGMDLDNLIPNDTFDGTWKTIVKGGETDKNVSVSPPSSFIHKQKNVAPISLVGKEKENKTCGLNEDKTLDDTWKTIMERRGEIVSPPSSLSFNESGMTNVPSRLISPRVPRQDALSAWRELRKSETFNESVQQRGGLVRRDPSLSLDDLNCRFDSFIKNFNHQMWLQRQESEQRLSELIKSKG